MGSEALLIYDISQGGDIYLLITVATIGNTLGSVVNYLFGLGGEKMLESKGLVDRDKFQRFKSIFNKYGGWTLLLSWMPIIGDLFTFVAGVARYRFSHFLALVFIAKLSRYVLLAWGHHVISDAVNRTYHYFNQFYL